MNALAASDSPAPAPPEVCRPDVLDTLANTTRARHERSWSLERADELLELVGLTEKKGAIIGALSRGMQQRLGLGDHLSLIFQTSPALLDFGRLPGVLRHTVQDSRVDLVLDRVDERLPEILEAVYVTGTRLAKVMVKPVDLEEIYHEITQ